MANYADIDWDDIELDQRHDYRYLDNLYLQLKIMKNKGACNWDRSSFLDSEAYKKLSLEQRKIASILDLEKSIECHLISLAKVFIAGPTNNLCM